VRHQREHEPRALFTCSVLYNRPELGQLFLSVEWTGVRQGGRSIALVATSAKLLSNETDWPGVPIDFNAPATITQQVEPNVCTGSCMAQGAFGWPCTAAVQQSWQNELRLIQYFFAHNC
jgi:hypothetical protein